MGRLSPIRKLCEPVLARLAQIGADPQDDEDTRAGKALLVLISVLILPVALLWAILYLAFGSPVGWVPLGTSRSCWLRSSSSRAHETSASFCSSARPPSCSLRPCR